MVVHSTSRVFNSYTPILRLPVSGDKSNVYARDRISLSPPLPPIGPQYIFSKVTENHHESNMKACTTSCITSYRNDPTYRGNWLYELIFSQARPLGCGTVLTQLQNSAALLLFPSLTSDRSFQVAVKLYRSFKINVRPCFKSSTVVAYFNA